VALFGGTIGGFCLAAPADIPAVPLPIELPATAPPADIGFVTPPAAAGFVAVPPIEGAGFEAPPIALCLVLAGPPSAFWAEEGWETAVVNTPSDVTSNVTLNIALRFMDAIL